MANEVSKKNPLKKLSEDQAAKMVLLLWGDFQRNTSGYRDKLRQWYNQYRGKRTNRSYDGLANVVVNESLAAIESIVAQIWSQLFSEPQRFYARPVEETDQKKAHLAEKLILASLECMDDKVKIQRNLRQYVKYGTTFAKVPRKYADKPIYRRKAFKDMNGTSGVEIVKEKTATYDDADLEYLELEDCAFDMKQGMENKRWFMVHRRVSRDSLVARAKNVVIGNLHLLKKPESIYSKSASKTDGQSRKMDESGIQYSQLRAYDYDLYEFWGLVPRWWVDDSISVDSAEAEDIVEAVIEVVDDGHGGITVRLEENPFWHQEKPFIEALFIAVDDEPYGMGVCEIVESLQEELSDKRCQALDWVSFNIFPMLEKLRSANIKREQVKKVPHQIVDSDVSGGLRPINIGGSINPSMVMDTVTKQDIRNQSGATNPVQGIPSQSDQTAYEVNVLERRGASRINLGAVAFGSTFYKRLLWFIWKLHQQYTTTERAVRIVGQEGIRWEKYAPGDLIHEYDFVPIIPLDMDSRILVRNQLIQFISSIAKYYPQTNAYKLVRKIYSLFGFDDTEEVIPAPANERGQDDFSIQEKIMLLSMGQKITVKFYDNHMQSMSAMEEYIMQNGRQLAPEVIDAFQDAISQHKLYLTALQAQMDQTGQPGQPGQGVPGAPPMGAGRGQMSNPVFNGSRTAGISQMQREVMNPVSGG